MQKNSIILGVAVHFYVYIGTAQVLLNARLFNIRCQDTTNPHSVVACVGLRCN